MIEELESKEVIGDVDSWAEAEPSSTQEGHVGISTSNFSCYIHYRPEDCKLYNELKAREGLDIILLREILTSSKSDGKPLYCCWG